MRLTIDVDLRVIRALQGAALGQGGGQQPTFSPEDRRTVRRGPRPDGCGVVVDIKI
jgi:hypothetical protein